MDGLLNPVQTRLTSRPINEEASVPPSSTPEETARPDGPSISDPDSALLILQSKPDHQKLLAALRYLDRSTETENGKDDFNIHCPGPKAAQILLTLINDVVPAHWDGIFSSSPAEVSQGDPIGTRSHHGKAEKLLLRCLRSVAGLGAVISRLRLLCDQNRSISSTSPSTAATISSAPRFTVSPSTQDLKRQERNDHQVDGVATLPLRQALSLLESILRRDDLVVNIWRDFQQFSISDTKKSLLWKEFLGLVAAGRVLSTASEAQRSLDDVSKDVEKGSWVSDGKVYSRWLGRNLRTMVGTKGRNAEMLVAAGDVASKGIRLGYEDDLVEEIFLDLFQGKQQSIDACRSFFQHLPTPSQKSVLYACLRILGKNFMSRNSRTSDASIDKDFVGGAAALLSGLAAELPFLQDALLDWLIKVPAEVVTEGHLLHRAVLLAIEADRDRIITGFKKSLEIFGDKLHIKHTPIFQQEVQTMTVAMLIGHFQRTSKHQLTNLARSSVYLNGISNHIAAASERPRMLGMIIGTLVSQFIDEKDKQLSFESVNLDSPDFLRFKSLACAEDQMGTIAALNTREHTSNKTSNGKSKSSRMSHVKATPSPKRSLVGSKIISIEEVEDGSSSEDDDLPVYGKIDSDPSDSEEDPELVQRNKPSAPVYIQDLIKGLRNHENYDRNRLALVNASSLIRRKSAFGSEVLDSIGELANILVGLNDRWEMDGFQRYRLQAMIAILVANPHKMAPWFAETFYNGDYSISQRASILTTLGLGAREIAGLGNEDAELTASDAPEASFPSKLLPEKLHKHYSPVDRQSSNGKSALIASTQPLRLLTSNLERSLIQPLAAQAADTLSGPNALKIRTFSSRLDVERKKTKPAPNPLAKIAAESFILPLIGRWQIHIRAHTTLFSSSASRPNPSSSSPLGSGGSGLRGSTASSTTLTSPLLLSTLLRTFALIIHAAGLTMVSLARVTDELWDWFLGLRTMNMTTATTGELVVLEALLFAILTLLDVNIAGGDQGRRLAEEHARELLETREWVEGILERVGTGGSGIGGGGGSLMGKGPAVGKKEREEREDDRVAMLAAAVGVRCREIVERYQRVLMGSMVDFM